jgi:biotin carboxyl carrier protein
MTYDIIIDGRKYKLELQRADKNKNEAKHRWQCILNGRDLAIDAALAQPNVLSILVEGRAYEVKREWIGSDLHLCVGSERYAAALHDPRSFRSRRDTAGSQDGPRKLVAPMPGKVVRVLVSEGETVEGGQGLMVVEAMKMQNEIKSPKNGIVRKVAVSNGDAVNAGDVMAIVE